MSAGGSSLSSPAFLSDVKLWAPCGGVCAGGPILPLAGRSMQGSGARRSLASFFFLACRWSALFEVLLDTLFRL